MWTFQRAMVASAIINSSGGAALILGLTPPSLVSIPLTKETSGYHMAMQSKGFFILALGIMNYLCCKNRDNELFVKTACGITAVGDIYYVGTRLYHYLQGTWQIEEIDKSIEYFGLVWCAIEFIDMVHFGVVNYKPNP